MISLELIKLFFLGQKDLSKTLDRGRIGLMKIFCGEKVGNPWSKGYPYGIYHGRLLVCAFGFI